MKLPKVKTKGMMMIKMTRKISKPSRIKWIRKIKRRMRREKRKNPRKRKERRLLPNQKQEM